MLLYIESKAFPYRTFPVRIQPYETIARVRAQLLHILYEIRREHHQFRLRHKGEYLRDAYTIEDYGICDSSIIKMVPLSKKIESMADLRNVHGGSDTQSDAEVTGTGITTDVKDALEDEIRLFSTREKLIFHLKGVLYIHFLMSLLCLLSTFWYSFSWSLVLCLIAYWCCPTFVKFGGFIGAQSIYKTEFCIVYGTGALAQMAACIFLAVHEWTRIVNHGCDDYEFVKDCSHVVVFSAVLYSVQAVCLMLSGCLAWALLWNIKIEYGDLIEKHLVQSRDIEDVMRAARSGRVKDRRQAAFELATMASSGDDNKFRIVAEGGLEVLTRMALSKDTATQEHAVETLTELMTVPAIQDNFVEMGGVRTLSALLHSRDQKLVYQAASALSCITSDSEENKFALSNDHGLEDLCHGARNSTSMSCQRLIAGIFLDLAFNSDIRMQLASMNTPAQALIVLCRSKDPDTQRFALQTLELLAIESSDMICAQTELLPLLLEIPSMTVDIKVYILAGKILLYYAENRETCEMLLDEPRCKRALQQYARTKDSIMQRVVVKVIYSSMENPALKQRGRYLELNEVLKYIQDNAADREVWDMADQALHFMNSDTDDHGLNRLPVMSAADKLTRMAPPNDASPRLKPASVTGSRASLQSRVSSGSSIRKPAVD